MTSRSSTASSPSRLEEVVQAAARLFHQKGYDGTSMQAIADEVGILKGSLYHYVNSKEELLYAIIEEFLDDVVSNADRVRASDGNPSDKLSALLRGHVLLQARRSVGASVLYGELRSLERLMTGPRRERFIERRKAYEEYIMELIIEGQKDGIFDRALGAKTISYGIFWMVNSILQWYRTSGKLSPDEVADEYVKFIIRGLSAD